MTKKFQLKNDRLGHPAGTIVYYFDGAAYKDLNDACSAAGGHHVAVTINQDGSFPFFTTRLDNLVPVVEQAPVGDPAPALLKLGFNDGMQEADAKFKNFHKQLCQRFDYHHDEVDWKRDQVSLIEHIAGLAKPPVHSHHTPLLAPTLQGQEPTNEQQLHTLTVAAIDAVTKAGIYNGEVPLTGPMLLMLLDDMAEAVARQEGQPDFAALEREHMGDPDKKTGIYAQHVPDNAHEAFAAGLDSPQTPTEQDGILLEQAATLLEELEQDERGRGNDSKAAGAGCSAHAVRRMTLVAMRAEALAAPDFPLTQEAFRAWFDALPWYVREMCTPAAYAPAVGDKVHIKPDNTAVICPRCVNQFRAIPVQVQEMLLAAGYKSPFLDATPAAIWSEKFDESMMQDAARSAYETACAYGFDLHSYLKLAKEIHARTSSAMADKLVTSILLEIVPGDGSGFEVYAKTTKDVEDKLYKIGAELEDWQLGIKRLPAQQGAQQNEPPNGICSLEGNACKCNGVAVLHKHCGYWTPIAAAPTIPKDAP